MKNLKLQDECGDTRISLDNSRMLQKQYGRPATVVLIKEDNEWYVDATWNNGFSHCFSGFSWGYGGEGPSGLGKFIDMFAIGERASSLGWTPSQDIPDGKNFTLFP
jgi:hypothetical protein